MIELNINMILIKNYEKRKDMKKCMYSYIKYKNVH